MRDPAAAPRCNCGMRRGESRLCAVDVNLFLGPSKRSGWVCSLETALRREERARGWEKRRCSLQQSPTCGWWQRVLRIRDSLALGSVRASPSRGATVTARTATTSARHALLVKKSSGCMNGPAMEEVPFPRVCTRWRKSRCLAGVCEREFDCKELETLFQKYNLKLEQTATLKALAILILTASALALVELLSAGSRFTVSKGSHPVHCVIFTSLFIVTNVKYLQVMQLQQIARLALLFSFTFALLCCPFPLVLGHGTQGAQGPDAPSATPEQGVWQLMLVTFVAYSLLPVRTILAVLFGILVAASHFIVTATSVTARRPHVWTPVSYVIACSIPEKKKSHLLLLACHMD